MYMLGVFAGGGTELDGPHQRLQLVPSGQVVRHDQGLQATIGRGDQIRPQLDRRVSPVQSSPTSSSLIQTPACLPADAYHCGACCCLPFGLQNTLLYRALTVGVLKGVGGCLLFCFVSKCSPLRQFFSPVSFAVNQDGTVRRGFPSIPGVGSGTSKRPLLFVGNHTFVGFDLGFLADDILRSTGIMPRGMAHPVIARNFQPPGSSEDDNLPEVGPADVLRLMGIVPVSGTSMYRVLEAGQTALLYPGGVREALKRKVPGCTSCITIHSISVDVQQACMNVGLMNPCVQADSFSVSRVKRTS